MLYMYVYICVYIYIYIYMCIDIYKHSYILHSLHILTIVETEFLHVQSIFFSFTNCCSFRCDGVDHRPGDHKDLALREDLQVVHRLRHACRYGRSAAVESG